MQSVITGDGFLGTEIDDKLAGYLALVKTVVVTGLKKNLSVGSLVTISTGSLVATICTSAIVNSLDVSIGYESLGDVLAVSIGYFYSSSVVFTETNRDWGLQLNQQWFCWG